MITNLNALFPEIIKSICEKKLGSPSISNNRKLESRHIQMKKNILL